MRWEVACPYCGTQLGFHAGEAPDAEGQHWFGSCPVCSRDYHVVQRASDPANPLPPPAPNPALAPGHPVDVPWPPAPTTAQAVDEAGTPVVTVAVDANRYYATPTEPAGPVPPVQDSRAVYPAPTTVNTAHTYGLATVAPTEPETAAVVEAEPPVETPVSTQVDTTSVSRETLVEPEPSVETNEETPPL